MGDSLRFEAFSPLPARWSHSGDIGGVEMANELLAEIDLPEFGLDAVQSDGLPHKASANKAQADQFKASDPIVNAKSQLAVSLCKLLRTLEQQLDQYRQQIQTLFAQHPDHDLFESLSGAKQVLAPRLLAATGNDPQRYGDDPNNAMPAPRPCGSSPARSTG